MKHGERHGHLHRYHPTGRRQNYVYGGMISNLPYPNGIARTQNRARNRSLSFNHHKIYSLPRSAADGVRNGGGKYQVAPS